MCESPPRSDGGSPQGGSPIYPRSTFSSRMPGLESFFFHICCKVPMWSYQKAINLYWNSYIARLFSQLFDFTRIYPPGISSLFKKNKSHQAALGTHSASLLLHPVMPKKKTSRRNAKPSSPYWPIKLQILSNCWCFMARRTNCPVIFSSSSLKGKLRSERVMARAPFFGFGNGVLNPSHGNGMEMAGTSFLSKKNFRDIYKYLSFWIGIHVLWLWILPLVLSAQQFIFALSFWGSWYSKAS